MEHFESVFKTMMGIYVIIILIGYYYCMRWALTAGLWFWRFKREHGLWKAFLLFYNPFQLWPTIRRIRREVPGADRTWKRALALLCTLSVCQCLIWFYWRVFA